jgi:hypothetical protein
VILLSFLTNFAKTLCYTELEDSVAECLFGKDVKEGVIASRFILMNSINIVKVLINALPGNSFVNTFQRVTMEDVSR